MGCLSFIVYGILIGALPIILTNTILLLINVYYLVKIHNTQEDFDLLEFRNDDKIIHKFLSFHHADIQAYFPGFQLQTLQNCLCFVVLRDMVIANIFVADVSAEGVAEVKINYTVPKYRDYKVGRFIFEKEKHFITAKGVRQIVYTTVANKNHEKFLKAMGFVRSGEGFKKLL
jgi:hypothetical protein